MQTDRAQQRVSHHVDRVVAPGTQDEVQPTRRIRELRVRIGPQRLPEGQVGIPDRARPAGHRAHERLDVREPEELHVALEEGAAGEEHPVEEEGDERREAERRSGTTRVRALQAASGGTGARRRRSSAAIARAASTATPETTRPNVIDRGR